MVDASGKLVKDLAPYAMPDEASLGRQYPEAEHPYRQPFQRDRDRIIHCTAFRRLEYKTQVFVTHEGDYYRTRLTHTIEVTQIARTIARALRLNEDLTEAIALAHDLGHTPFGHSGEEALHELMKDHGGFEHNAQGVRVVELLEYRYPDFPGLNLSWEVRESMLKHKTIYDQPVDTVFHPEWQPLLEAQVVDAADSIAYDNHDLDDGLKAGLITEADLKDLELWQMAYRQPKPNPSFSDKEIRRSQMIITLINLEVTDLIEYTLRRLEASRIKDVSDIRLKGERLVSFSPETVRMKSQMQEFLFKKMYLHYRVARMAKKAKRFIKEMFTAYIDDPKQLPTKYQEWTNQPEVGRHRAVCDYIAGMTDRYAQQEYKKLFYPFERV